MKKFWALMLVASGALVMTGEVQAADKEKKDPPSREQIFKRLDKDGDSQLTLDEFKGKKQGKGLEKAEALFKKMDKNSDGNLSQEEFVAGPKKKKKDA